MHQDYDLFLVMENCKTFLKRQAQTNVWAELTVTIIATLNNQFLKNARPKELQLRLKTKRENELYQLAILSWYLPEEIRFLLQLEIERVATKLNYLEVVLTLSSEGHSSVLLSNIVTRKGPNHLFGNILDKNQFDKLHKLFQVKARLQDIGPAIPEKRRIAVGYNDKGSHPDLACGGALGSITDSKLQKEIEYNRKCWNSTLLLYDGWNF